MALENETRIFESHKDEWLKDHYGEFVLIHASDFSFHASDSEAYSAGIAQWGEVDLFIKQVLPDEPVEDSVALLYGLVNVAS